MMRIDVRVHDAARMGMRQRGTDIADDRPRMRSLHRHAMACSEHSLQGGAAEKFHRKKSGFAVAVELVNPHDVWMRQQLQTLKRPLQ